MTLLADVELHGSSIPINRLSLLVGVLGAVLALLVWRRLADRTGWRPLPALAMLLSFAFVIALTLPPNGRGTESIAECLPTSWADLGSTVGNVGQRTENLLNVLLLIPLGLFGVLATRRVWLPALAVLALPGVVELVQTLIPGRQCSPADYLANSIGGLVAVVAGLLPERRRRVREWLDEPRQPSRVVSGERP